MLALEDYLKAPDHPSSKLAYPTFWALGFLQAPEGLQGSYCKIGKPCVIDRGSDADIVISDPTVSREHVRLTPRGLFLEVEDLVSSNGTIIDGEPLHGIALCSAGSNVEMGNVRIRIGKSRPP